MLLKVRFGISPEGPFKKNVDWERRREGISNRGPGYVQRAVHSKKSSIRKILPIMESLIASQNKLRR